MSVVARNLLHVSKLDDFRAWLDSNGIPYRAGRGFGTYQVMQVRVTTRGRDIWTCVYARKDMKEHYTVQAPLVPYVRRFIHDTGAKA